MKKKAETGTDYPQTQQRRYPVPGSELGMTNAIPRCTEFDLVDCYSKTRVGSWGDEQTFKVVKKGNCP